MIGLSNTDNSVCIHARFEARVVALLKLKEPGQYSIP